MDNSESASYRAGEAKGQAQEKGNQLMDKASNAAQSAKESVQEVIPSLLGEFLHNVSIARPQGPLNYNIID